MTSEMSLTNHLLVAMPSVSDINFTHSVIYVCEHQAYGSVGLIINKPMSHTLDLIFNQLSITPLYPNIANMPLLFGGLLQPERGFVIHRPWGEWNSTLSLSDTVSITTSNDIIRAIAENKGPKDAMIALGHVRWEEKQLEQEVRDNVWLICPNKPELLYEVPFAQRWERAGLSIGVDMHKLSSDVGHA